MNATLLPDRAAESAIGRAPVFHRRLQNGWVCEVVDRIEAIEPETWAAMFPPHWKDWRYFRTLEETFPTEFPQRYLLLRTDDGELLAILPLFLVTQDLTAGLGDRARRWLKPWRRVLTARLLVAGCIVGDARIGVPDAAHLPAVCPWLDEALGMFAQHVGVSLLLYKDVPGEHRDGLAALVAQRRCLRMPSLPGVSLKLDFADFDEYLRTRLGKSTRKSLRRKFRAVEALESPCTLEVRNSVDDTQVGELHALYERVALRGDVHFEVFTREYFLRLAERMPDQARYFIWRQAGRVVAFSFCTVHGDTIYDNDLGLEETAASALHLYHITFRDIVRWALAQGLRRYESCPFNYHPKLHLRMELVPLDLYARHTSPILNALLHWIAPLAAPTRQEPLLKHFPNAAEI